MATMCCRSWFEVLRLPRRSVDRASSEGETGATRTLFIHIRRLSERRARRQEPAAIDLLTAATTTPRVQAIASTHCFAATVAPPRHRRCAAPRAARRKRSRLTALTSECALRSDASHASLRHRLGRGRRARASRCDGRIGGPARLRTRNLRSTSTRPRVATGTSSLRSRTIGAGCKASCCTCRNATKRRSPKASRWPPTARSRCSQLPRPRPGPGAFMDGS